MARSGRRRRRRTCVGFSIHARWVTKEKKRAPREAFDASWSSRIPGLLFTMSAATSDYLPPVWSPSRLPGREHEHSPLPRVVHVAPRPGAAQPSHHLPNLGERNPMSSRGLEMPHEQPGLVPRRTRAPPSAAAATEPVEAVGGGPRRQHRAAAASDEAAATHARGVKLRLSNTSSTGYARVYQTKSGNFAYSSRGKAYTGFNTAPDAGVAFAKHIQAVVADEPDSDNPPFPHLVSNVLLTDVAWVPGASLLVFMALSARAFDFDRREAKAEFNHVLDPPLNQTLRPPSALRDGLHLGGGASLRSCWSLPPHKGIRDGNINTFMEVYYCSCVIPSGDSRLAVYYNHSQHGQELLASLSRSREGHVLNAAQPVLNFAQRHHHDYHVRRTTSTKPSVAVAMYANILPGTGERCKTARSSSAAACIEAQYQGAKSVLDIASYYKLQGAAHVYLGIYGGTNGAGESGLTMYKHVFRHLSSTGFASVGEPAAGITRLASNRYATMSFKKGKIPYLQSVLYHSKSFDDLLIVHDSDEVMVSSLPTERGILDALLSQHQRRNACFLSLEANVAPGNPSENNGKFESLAERVPYRCERGPGAYPKPVAVVANANYLGLHEVGCTESTAKAERHSIPIRVNKTLASVLHFTGLFRRRWRSSCNTSWIPPNLCCDNITSEFTQFARSGVNFSHSLDGRHRAPNVGAPPLLRYVLGRL